MNTTVRIILLAFLATGAQAEIAKGNVFTLDPQAQIYVAAGEIIIDDRTTKIRTRIGHTASGDVLVYDLFTRATGLPDRKNMVQLSLRWSLTGAEYAALAPTMPSQTPVLGKNEVIPDADFDAIQGPDIKELHPSRPAP
ncbi:MAG: hypothetical protein H0X38_04260 [Planctomycetes bacterium]|nr:hypothetical protein [Planctomycetota bacterium]